LPIEPYSWPQTGWIQDSLIEPYWRSRDVAAPDSLYLPETDVLEHLQPIQTRQGVSKQCAISTPW
jgi:hypothetical protein